MAKTQRSKRINPQHEAARRRAAEAIHRRAQLARQFTRADMTPELAEAVRRTRAVVTRARIVETNAQARVDAAVIRLRDLGCSWKQIAAAIDTSTEGARKRHVAATEREQLRLQAKTSKDAATSL